MKYVLEFLFELYSSGLGYSALNTARSAISAVLQIKDLPVGEHPLVKRFMKGVFNCRPSLPRYNCIWDTTPVLKKLETFYPANTLTLKLLSFKVVFLLALLTTQRTQTLYDIKLSDIILQNDQLQITWSSVLKQSRPGYNLEPVVFESFEQNKRLCIVYYMKHYLSRTKYLRKKEQRLFISYKQPYEAITKNSLARWIRTAMSMCGIDINKFKPHSVRAAGVSKAVKFAPVEQILKSAGWSNKSTFTRFYKKPVTKEHFMKDILNAVSNE